jgi:general secretion pathway protein C
MVSSEPAPAPPPPAPVVPAGPPPRTSLPLTLVATNVARDAKDSTAVVDDKFYGAMAYGIADHLPGAGPIVAISGRYVDFQNRRSGQVERLDLLGEATPAPQPQPNVARNQAPVGKAPADDLGLEVDNAVSKKDDTHYTVSRSFVDKVLANPMVMMGQLRARPTAEGLRLSGVKEGSPASKIGLRQGDVITALNGHETAGGNLDKMLELYSKLKSASSLSVQVKRGGQTISLEYAIQ